MQSYYFPTPLLRDPPDQKLIFMGTPEYGFYNYHLKGSLESTKRIYFRFPFLFSRKNLFNFYVFQWPVASTSRCSTAGIYAPGNVGGPAHESKLRCGGLMCNDSSLKSPTACIKVDSGWLGDCLQISMHCCGKGKRALMGADGELLQRPSGPGGSPPG